MVTKYTKNIERNFLLVIVIIFTLLTFYLLKDIFALLIYSMILSYFLYPLYKKYYSKIQKEAIASLLTLLTSIFIVFIPIALLVYFLVINLVKLVVQYKTYIENPDILNMTITIFLEKITHSNFLSGIDFSQLITKTVSFILDISQTFFSEIPIIIGYFFVVLFISYYMLIYNKKIFALANEYIPLGIKKQNHLLNSIERTLKILFKGYFLTGIIQTIVALIGYVVFGAPNILIITFLTLFASLIPYLGTPLVWVPVSLYMMAVGNETSGIWLLLYGTLIINLVDNFLRPFLMSTKETLHPALVFISFIGGLIAFGIVGIILGPIIISITAILLRYLKEMYEVS